MTSYCTTITLTNLADEKVSLKIQKLRDDNSSVKTHLPNPFPLCVFRIIRQQVNNIRTKCQRKDILAVKRVTLITFLW